MDAVLFSSVLLLLFVQVGDEVTMVSATFGDEMWSARNVGKYRLEKSIAVRQGMQISFVFENSNDSSKKAREVHSAALFSAEFLAWERSRTYLFIFVRMTVTNLLAKLILMHPIN